MTGSFCSRNFQRSALRVFCLVSRFWSLIRSLPLMESLIWKGEHHKQPRLLVYFLFFWRQTEEEKEHKTLLFVAPAHLSTADSSHVTHRVQLLRRKALLCSANKTSETKNKILELGQFEKRLSRSTVPLPRPSKSSAAQWRRRGAETELEHNPV